MTTYYESYTACIVQPVLKFAYRRADITENLEKYLRMIDGCMRRFGGKGAPLKLFAFPEFFLQGFTTSHDVDLETYRREILITLPGPETDALAAKAREHDVFIAGCCLEHDPALPEYYFNCAFIINPDGEIIHKYRKAIPAIHAEMAMSPHDLMDHYLELYGEGRDKLAVFFPVTETAIGRLGTFICMDGHFPEVTRALTFQGAEILLRPPAYPEPLVSPPMYTWELQNRVRAHENIAYVIAPNTGGLITDELPAEFTPGDSMIVDYKGVVQGRAPYPGETVVASEINLKLLRSRRQEPRRNFLAQIRSEMFDTMYDSEIYPANMFLQSPLNQRSEMTRRSPEPVIKQFFASGRFPRPE